jgi:bifunctional non-homologous end joining protein LigD
MTEELKIGRRTVRVTHPDKALWPRITKRDLARHYERVSPVMLPYLSGRPLALQAFPDGIDGQGYFMKAVPDYFPDWVKRATVAKRGGTVTHALAEDAATLVYLAGQNVVTIHGWLSRADEPRKPDRLIIDFDPSKQGGFADVRAAAREAGERLRDTGLSTYAMTTGSRGIHVVCPLRRGAGFRDVHRFAKALAQEMVEDSPGKLTLEYLKANREGKIYVDVNRNAYAQHGVMPYSPRAKPRAPVAVPLDWEELSDARLKPERWTVRNVGARLEAEGDPWKGMARRARALPASRRR